MINFKKTLAVLSSAALLLSCTSCAFNMRDTYDKTEEQLLAYNEDEPTLNVAERVNTLDDSDTESNELGLDNVMGFAPNEPATTSEVTVVITGDIKLDEAMIADAKAQAPEGKDYSFLRMYTGVYRTINDADIAVGGYSAIGKPYGTDAEYEPPVEHLDALSAVGFDLLDISGVGNDYSVLEEHGISGFSYSDAGDEPFRSIEKDGLTFTFASIGGTGCAQSYKDDALYENLEFADLPADVLVAIVHWDEEITTEEISATSKRLADSGVDVILGCGDTLGRTETIETEDGGSALVCNSLGNLLSSAEEGYGLVSGIVAVKLTMTTDIYGDKITSEISVIPAVTHYAKENKDYCVYRLADYTDELAQTHGAEVDVEGLTDYVNSKIPTELIAE